MKILIVDDEYDKALEITQFLGSLNIDIVVEHATTSGAARKALRGQHFDFVVIDLNLPSAVGAPPSPDGGIQLYDMLFLDEKTTLPIDILFLTGKEDLIDDASGKITMRGGILCRFGASSEQWKQVLAGKIKLAAERARRAKRERPRVDIAVITALLTPELSAVLDLKYQWEETRFPNDPTQYHMGKFDREGQEITVMAASAGRKGMSSSAALAAKIVERFRPQYIAMLGICAGVRGKVGLGDVVVADPSWDWGSGKVSEAADGSSVFQAAPYQRQLSPAVSQLAMELGRRPETARSITAAWSHSTPAGNLSIHVGPMASGAAVLANSDAVLPISAQNRELLAIEMEAYAVMAAADYAVAEPPIALAIKSVCDFADAQKSDDWQTYAAFTSARFFDCLVRNPSLVVRGGP